MVKAQTKCLACGKYLAGASAGATTCSTCPYVYHKACVAIPDNTSVAKEWTCPECKKKQRKGDNSSTPAKNVCGSIGTSPGPGTSYTASINPEEISIQPVTTLSAEPILGAEVREMRQELAKYMAEQREFRQDIRASITRLESRLDGFELRLEAVEREKTAPGETEISELKKAVSQLQQELNDRDQDALLSDLDIGQLPEEKGESVQHTVTLLAAKLGIQLKEEDIVFAERVGPLSGVAPAGAPARPRRLVVRLARRRLRDDLLAAARVRRNITSADMGLAGPPRRVYVNERLTRLNRHLFYRVREECRRHEWRYSWTKKGRVYMRQSDGKRAHLIRSDDDLIRVFNTDTV